MNEMDATDLFIIEALRDNSRMPYRELADKLDISVNAVHNRIQNLFAGGTLTAMFARLGFAVERPIITTVFGHSSTSDLRETIRELGRDPCTNQVAVATGNFIYHQRYLHNLSELDDIIELAREQAMIESPELVFRSVPTPVESSIVQISDLEWRLIYALFEDSRRPVADLAGELGVTPKTVRRHLRKMEAEGSILYTIQWLPTSSHDIFCFVHATLDKRVDRRQVALHLKEAYGANLREVTPLDSAPQFLFLSFWAKTMKELKALITRVEREPTIVSFFINIYFDTYYFDTWREDLVRSRALKSVHDR
jgi:DNA-binding Lrp family transcriptional regulator